MNKRIAYLIIPLLLALTACGSGDEKPQAVKSDTVLAEAAPTTVTTPEPAAVEKPSNLDGTWATTDKGADAMAFTAEVSGDHIVVNYADNTDPDYSALYWIGTFPGGGSHILSQGDVAEMETALLASTDSTKDFTLKDDELSFKFSAMGISQTIRLHHERK